MENLKRGDVVHLNSEERMMITVGNVNEDGTFQGVYFNVERQEFLVAPKLHSDMVKKVS